MELARGGEVRAAQRCPQVPEYAEEPAAQARLLDTLLLLHASIGRDPVHFPGLSSVVGERLLEADRIRRERRDDEANQDGAAPERVLAEKLAAPVLELAVHRRAQRTAAAVREVQAPLVRVGVVEAQAQALDGPLRAVDLELHQIGAAVPNLSHRGRAGMLDPGGGARQGMR